MKNLFKNLFALLLLGGVVFYFYPQIKVSVFQLRHQYLPCIAPVKYSLGDFDDRFGMTEEEFLDVLKEAEQVWETPMNNELFKYTENKNTESVKINLIYDSRQESTEKLKTIGGAVDEARASYDALKEKFDNLKTEYLKMKSAFEARFALLETRKNQYEKEVEYVNAQGGATKEEYRRLEQEKLYINKEIEEINQIQKILNAKALSVNELVNSLNSLASSLNLDVRKFNEVGSENGEEFEEGIYESDMLGTRINVFQYENRDKLLRVLAHEFGHALGLEHIDNKEAIMYRLNSGENLTPTEDELNALRQRCDSRLI